MQEIIPHASPQRDHHRHDRTGEEVPDAQAREACQDRRHRKGQLRQPRNGQPRFERVRRW